MFFQALAMSSRSRFPVHLRLDSNGSSLIAFSSLCKPILIDVAKRPASRSFSTCNFVRGARNGFRGNTIAPRQRPSQVLTVPLLTRAPVNPRFRFFSKMSGEGPVSSSPSTGPSSETQLSQSVQRRSLASSTSKSTDRDDGASRDVDGECNEEDADSGDTEFEIRESDLEEQFVRGSGPGGQKINKTSVCVVR